MVVVRISFVELRFVSWYSLKNTMSLHPTGGGRQAAQENTNYEIASQARDDGMKKKVA